MRIAESTRQVSATRKRNFKAWVIRVLEQPLLETDTTRFPDGEASYRSASEVYLTIDGIPRRVYAGHWQLTGSNLFLAASGGEDSSISLVDKLAILASLISYYEAWDDEKVVDAYSKAMSNVLLQTYNSFLHGAILSAHKATKLAFNAGARKFAAFIEDGWYLHDGTKVDVEDEDGWTVAA